MYRKYGDTWFDDQFGTPSLSSILIGDAQRRAIEGGDILYGFESDKWEIQANLRFRGDVVDMHFYTELKPGLGSYYKESVFEGLSLEETLEKSDTVLEFLGITAITWISSPSTGSEGAL
jgi:hypothetical protein